MTLLEDYRMLVHRTARELPDQTRLIWNLRANIVLIEQAEANRRGIEFVLPGTSIETLSYCNKCGYAICEGDCK